MLALLPLLVALFAAAIRVLPTPAHANCPSAPLAIYTTAARTCPALEISGRIDPSGIALDPAFDEDVAPVQLARAGRGDAQLSGYSGDGRTLFVFPFAASSTFHFYVPLASAQAVQKLRLATPIGVVERTAAPHGEPVAEAVAVDERRFVFAWDAHVFPAVRLESAPGTVPIAYGGGESTYQQLNVESAGRRISVEFSDGLRSVTRTVRIFGR